MSDPRAHKSRIKRIRTLSLQACTYDEAARVKANVALLREHMRGRDKTSLAYRRALATIEALETGQPYRGPAKLPKAGA